MALRTLRQKPRISYFEPEEPSLDEYVFCEKCADYVYEYCSIHGALLVIPDDKVPAKPNFPSFVPRAALTIPHVFLHINYSTIPGAGLGVFSTRTLPTGVRFGPYRGERTNDITSDYSWQIYDRNNKPSHVVDASDGNKSNWMRYVNCARHWIEQNLVAYQYQGQLYYRTIRIIPRFTELMVFYGSEYANLLDIDLGKYNSPRSYAQKFGAPPPKKPKFSVPKKTSQAVVETSVDNRNSDKLAIADHTTQPNPIVQQASKKKIEENKSQNGAFASKKRKIEVEKKSHPLNFNAKPLGITNQHAVELENELNKTKTKKTSTGNKSRSHKRTKNVDKTSNLETKLSTNMTSKENGINSNTDCTKLLDDKVTSKEHNLGKEIVSPISKREKVGQRNQKPDGSLIEDVYFFCDVCKYQTVTKVLLEKHMRFHDINRKFVCETCAYRFASSVRLDSHRFHKHKIKISSMKVHECNICDYTTLNQSNLKMHLLKHAGLKSVSCKLCNYVTVSAVALKRHLRTHTGEKPYSCDVCDYKCSRAGSLKNHLRTHTGEKPYSCDVCDYKCSRAGSLKNHLRTHTGEKPYSCDVCDYKCSLAGTLKRHLRTHTGEKPYSCDVCDYKYSQAGDLKRHLRTHTGEKPYSCDVCDYKCSHAGDLKRHLRTHTGEKPYSCDVCDYKCSRADHLKIHLRTHTGEKPYSCDVCDYKCSQAGTLKSHKRST